MDSKSIFFIRHATTQMVERGDISKPGPNEPLSLAAKNIIDRLNLFEKIGKPSIIYTSPLLRARQTAELIRESFNCKIPIQICNETQEWIMPSSIIGKNRKNYPLEYKEYRLSREQNYNLRYEDNESINEFFMRVQYFKHKLSKNFFKKNSLFVSHFCFIRMLCSLHMTNTSEVKQNHKLSQELHIDHLGMVEIKGGKVHKLNF